MISKRLFIATILIAGITLAPRAAGACSCTGEVTFEQAFAGAKQIFLGTLVDVRTAEPEYPMMVWVRLAVIRSWKGSPGDTASVLTGENDGVCGYHFWPEEQHLVYAQPWYPGDEVFTHSCSRSHQTWPGDPDIDALDEVTPVRASTWGALKLLYR